MKKLSVIIITFNEERNIRRCIESVRDIADEIVVVDSMSTDSTEEICNTLGVRFFSQKWLGYSEQKNFANSLASNDWILSIDADEALSEELKKSITELKKRDFDEHNVFCLNRLTNYCGHWIRHCGWYPDRKIRIWNRNVGKWKGEIHETIEFTTETKDNLLRGDMLHYSFNTPEDFEKQMTKFALMRGKHYFMKGRRNAGLNIIFSPIYAFIKHYIFQLGFLDGADGLHICRITAKTTKLKYKTLKELTDKDK
ncbi:MAG: glycosyltransferase family 2 protein [Bacteroidales bacterium]|nr:glycosyltransferase family 2 protein [Bacteroidales bacterium]MCQ2316858.1 glycosyltransferase family 2 protein [Bacteroidales bacterium]